jgi:HlyD family secretion protein
MRVLAAVLLGALLAGCGDASDGVHQGYVEGDPLLVAPKASGQLSRLAVDAGAQVAAGDVLFALDAEAVLARRDRAAARVAQAEAQLDNLQKGDRPEEIAVIDARIAEAEARLVQAQRQFERSEALLGSNAVSVRAFDAARAERDIAAAGLERLRRERRAARLPARADEIEAARRNAAAAAAELAEARAALRERSVVAPRSGTVQDVFYREGEVVGEGRPVLALLPPDNRKVLFFVPEPALSSVRLGGTVGIGCDGCPPGQRARVTFVSDRAEFTPPVIFSVQTRHKLVYKVEAVPLAGAAALKPGQPVDVLP